jgi:O-antigen ligase
MIVIFYFLILVMPLSQHRIWAQFVGDLTSIKYIGLVCLPYAIFHLAQRRSVPQFFGTWQARLFGVLYLWATLSYLVFGRTAYYLSHWLTYTSFLVLFFITMAVVDTLSRLRWLLLTASASLALASLYVLRDWQTFHALYRDYRPGFVVGDPNYFTVSVLLFIPVTFLMTQQSRPRWQRWFCLGCFVVTLFGVMVSASRGGFLGMVAGSLYLILRSRRRLRNLALIASSLVLVTVFSPLSPVSRFQNPTAGDQVSVDTHVALMHAGFRMMLAHPVFGVGLDNFPMYVAQYVSAEEAARMDRVRRVAHNSYAEIAAEMGIPGLLLFLGMLFCSYKSLERVAQVAKRCDVPLLHQAALGLQAGFVGSSIASFFVSGEYQKMVWMTLFVSMCLPALAAQIDSKRKNLPSRTDDHLSAGGVRAFQDAETASVET